MEMVNHEEDIPTICGVQSDLNITSARISDNFNQLFEKPELEIIEKGTMLLKTEKPELLWWA